MTKRVVLETSSVPRRRRRAGVTLAAALVFLACASWTGAQPAVESDVAIGPAQPPAERIPGPGPSVAEASDRLRFQFTPKFLTGVPIGSFGNRIGATPGGAVDFAARVGRTPVLVGVALDYLRYGTETRRVALYPGVPEVFSDVDTTNNLFRSHALVRFQSAAGRARPYAEGLLGFSYTYTHTSIDLGHAAGRAGTTHLGDFAPSFGAGGGVTIGLVSRPDAHVALDVGLRYITGGDVDYLTRGELRRNGDGVTFTPTRSPASLFALQLGVAVDF